MNIAKPPTKLIRPFTDRHAEFVQDLIRGAFEYGGTSETVFTFIMSALYIYGIDTAKKQPIEIMKGVNADQYIELAKKMEAIIKPYVQQNAVQ